MPIALKLEIKIFQFVFPKVYFQKYLFLSVFFRSIFIQSVFLRNVPDLRVFEALRVYYASTEYWWECIKLILNTEYWWEWPIYQILIVGILATLGKVAKVAADAVIAVRTRTQPLLK